MKIIWLTQGQFTLVDNEDYEFLSQWRWYAQKIRNAYYASRDDYTSSKRKKILMHRLLINTDLFVDHRDRNGLNNQRDNLRIATASQNQRNRRSCKQSTSKYLGVFQEKGRKKWVASIGNNGQKIRIGRFLSEEDAALAYNEAAIKFHGEFANLNQL